MQTGGNEVVKSKAVGVGMLSVNDSFKNLRTVIDSPFFARYLWPGSIFKKFTNKNTNKVSDLNLIQESGGYANTSLE